MPCFSPLRGWLSAERTALGKRSVVFNPRFALRDRPVSVPCGQCIGCRLERSRKWAVRCVYEASLYEDNCFITLTYDDAHLPRDLSLNVAHFQKFMKRLRKRFVPEIPSDVVDRDEWLSLNGIRFFHCGEYGENFGRPHYHACIFNFDFPDRKLWSVRQGVSIYTSAALAELWPFGFSTVGDVTFESAAYVARYVLKKVTGKNAPDHYDFCDPITGQIFSRSPEYVTMSRRRGIGRGWFDKFHSEVYPSDGVLVNGHLTKPPRYYDGCFEADFLESGSSVLSLSNIEKIKLARKRKAALFACDNTDERLKVRQTCVEARVGFLKRTLT